MKGHISRTLLVMIISFGYLGMIAAQSSHAQSSYSYSGTLSVGGTTEPFEHSYIEYSIPVHSGDILDIEFSYSGDNICSTASLTFEIDYFTLSEPGLPLGPFTGTRNYLHQSTKSKNLIISIRLNSLHSWICYATLDYTLTVSFPMQPILDDSSMEPIGMKHLRYDQAIPLAIYVSTSEAASGNRCISIWQRGENRSSYLAVEVTCDKLLTLPDFPAENTLIADTDDGFITVYKLTTGEFQVNVGPLSDGKVHVTIFDGIPPTHTYGYTWEVPATTP